MKIELNNILDNIYVGVYYYIPSAGYRDNQIVEYEIESWLNNIQEYQKRESTFKEKLI